MAASSFCLVGKSYKRDDGPLLASGSALCTDDLRRPALLYVGGGPRSLPPRGRFQRSDIRAYGDLRPLRSRRESGVHTLRSQGP